MRGNATPSEGVQCGFTEKMAIGELLATLEVFLRIVILTIIGYGELHPLPHCPLNSLVTSNSLDTRQLIATRLFSDSKECHF